MAISTRIKQLTELALSDKVLTYVERENIIKAGLQEGATAEELNEYMNKALEAKIHSMAKEDLNHCPNCGAQVPLISDQCPFCGYKYEKSQKGPLGSHGKTTGEEADIISNENAKNCPDCGSPLPLISNVCPVCKHILHEQRDSQLNVNYLVDGINQSIERIKNNRKTTVSDLLHHWSGIVCLYLAALGLIIFLIGMTNGANIFGCISLLITIVLIFIAFKKMTRAASGDSPVSIEDNIFYISVYKYETYSRQVDTLYGNHPEANEALTNFSKVINDLKAKKKTNRRKLFLMMLGITVLVSLLPLLITSPKTNYDKNLVEYAESYEFAKQEAVLKPMDAEGYTSNITPFLKCSEGTLRVDIIPNEWYLSSTDYNKFKIRIDNVCLTSTGKANLQSDTLMPIDVMFFDKDFHRIGKELPPVTLNLYEKKQYPGKDLNTIMENAAGSCYADFVSLDTLWTTNEVKNIFDSAYYFILY